MACKQAVRLCDDACGFDENRRETRKVYDTLPRSVSAPEPCDAVLYAWACIRRLRVQLAI